MAKRAVLALLEDSYQKRDKVGFIAVAGYEAQVLLPLTSSVELAVRCLRKLPVQGRTPLPDGLYKGLQVLKTQLWKNRNILPIMVLVSDGRGNVALVTDVRNELISIANDIRKQGIRLVVIDTDNTDGGFPQVGHNCNREIAEASGGAYYTMDELDSKKVVDVVKAIPIFS
jgi:magnesium chelatase subunit D